GSLAGEPGALRGGPQAADGDLLAVEPIPQGDGVELADDLALLDPGPFWPGGEEPDTALDRVEDRKSTRPDLGRLIRGTMWAGGDRCGQYEPQGDEGTDAHGAGRHGRGLL